MEFTSFGFLLYFLPVMLAGYYLLSPFKKIKNIWIILCGLGFYFLNGIECVVLLAALAVLNYVMGFIISHFMAISADLSITADKDTIRKAKKAARNVMKLSIAVNLAPLFIFIFIPEFLRSLTQWIDFKAQFSFIAPFGIAFLALQGISYTADILNGKVNWKPDITNALVYFTFFPAAFAGPIIKYHEMADQIESREITFDKISEGLCRLVVGLAKLCVIAEPLLAVSTIITDRSNVSGLYANVPVSLTMVGLISCIIGLYHFFSGFSDVAIGMGKMLGFSIPENFRHPHLATTVTAFWQRCYSSLTGWFEEYVYDSLSKKRSNNDQMVLHMLLCGC